MRTADTTSHGRRLGCLLGRVGLTGERCTVLEPWHQGGECAAHCGMHFRHDFHHRYWNHGNYGGAFSHFWDWLCGTDVDYWKFKQGKLERVNMSVDGAKPVSKQQ